MIFADALEEAGGAVEQDAVVLVKGKVDHKDASRTCVVVSSVERFEPSDEELRARRAGGGARGRAGGAADPAGRRRGAAGRDRRSA